MHYLVVFLNLAFVAFILIYQIALLYSVLVVKYRLRKLAKKIKHMHLPSRKLTPEEAAACKVIYPRKEKQITAGEEVITISGSYGYTIIRDRYGRETRMNHAIGPLPFYFLQCMESSLNEETQNTAELIVLSDGTMLPLSLNDSWTVRNEAAVQKALKTGFNAISTSGGSKISDRNELPSTKEYRIYHPSLRITASFILLIGIVLLLSWEQDTPDFLLYTGAMLTLGSFVWILSPGRSRAVKKTRLVTLSGTIALRGNRVLVDRFLVQVPPKGENVLEEGKKVLLEGWVHPKKQVKFYTTRIRDQYNETLWSLEATHWSRAWMRFIIPLGILVFSCIIYADVNNSFTIAKDYWNWKNHGQTVQTFTSIDQLTETLKEPDGIPPGSMINLENFALVRDQSQTGTKTAYKAMEKGANGKPDFSKAKNRAKCLVRFIRTPLATSIFVGMNYPTNQLSYISMFIDQYTSDEQVGDFAEEFSDSVHFSSFLEAAEAFESTPVSTNTNKLIRTWKAFLREEITAINELISQEFSHVLLDKKYVLLSSNYSAPTAPAAPFSTYLNEGHFNPYRIPYSHRNPFPQRGQESWIADPPFYETVFDELEQRYREFPPVTGEEETVLVTGTSITPSGEHVLEVSFSLYRVERALAEWGKIKILLVLAGLSIILVLSMSGCLLREFIKMQRRPPSQRS